MRLFRPLVIFLLIAAMVMPSVGEAARGKRNWRVGEQDPRYAALIMNPVTGEVYHARNADIRRYPASLTKMMTLYLLFEALEQKKLSLHDKLRVSDYATTMPQTNLSLTTFDRIPVETAIKALVVRSANDVAVVVAEHLGGSVQNFAVRATNKARALGMNNTVFKNPHGLPNDAQYTTARDMAKLGIALKRDFPQYYHYFQTRQFSWKGTTYYTHNRVMLRYAGTDGIKTGYINKSGFNLVTSCTKGGRPLLGVVLGGTSGAWRDTQMIKLLDKGYKVIATRGQKTGRIYAANLPIPRPGSPQALAAAAAEKAKQAATAPVQLTTANIPSPTGQPTALHTPTGQPTTTTTVTGTNQVITTPIPANSPFAAMTTTTSTTMPSPTPPGTQIVPGTTMAVPTPQRVMQSYVPTQGGLTSPDHPTIWGIQVGAFSSQALAEQAVRQAYSQAANNLQGSRMSVIGAGEPGSTIHRARLENLSEIQAKKACEILISHNSPCFIYRADGPQKL